MVLQPSVTKQLCRWINALGFQSALLVDSIQDLRDGTVFCDLVSLLVEKELCRPEQVSALDQVYVVYEVALRALRDAKLVDVSSAGDVWALGNGEPDLRVVCNLFQLLREFVERKVAESQEHEHELGLSCTEVSNQEMHSIVSPSVAPPAKIVYKRKQTHTMPMKHPAPNRGCLAQVVPNNKPKHIGQIRMADGDLGNDAKHQTPRKGKVTKGRYNSKVNKKKHGMAKSLTKVSESKQPNSLPRPSWNSSTLVENTKPRNNICKTQMHKTTSTTATGSVRHSKIKAGPKGKGVAIGDLWDPGYVPSTKELMVPFEESDNRSSSEVSNSRPPRRVPAKVHTRATSATAPQATPTYSAETTIEQRLRGISSRLPLHLSRIFNWLAGTVLGPHLCCADRPPARQPSFRETSPASRSSSSLSPELNRRLARNHSSVASNAARIESCGNPTIGRTASLFSDGTLLCLLLGSIDSSRDSAINGTEKSILVNGRRQRCVLPRGVTPNPDTSAAKNRNVKIALDLLRSQKRLDQRFLWSTERILEGNPEVIWGLLGDIRDAFGNVEHSTSLLLPPPSTQHRSRRTKLPPDSSNEVPSCKPSRQGGHHSSRSRQGGDRGSPSSQRGRRSSPSRQGGRQSSSTRRTVKHIEEMVRTGEETLHRRQSQERIENQKRRAVSSSPTPRKSRPLPSEHVKKEFPKYRKASDDSLLYPTSQRQVISSPSSKKRWSNKTSDLVEQHPLLLVDSPEPSQQRKNTMKNDDVVTAIETQTRRLQILSTVKSERSFTPPDSGYASELIDCVPKISQLEIDQARVWLHKVGFNILRVPDRLLGSKEANGIQFKGYEGGPIIQDPFRNGMLLNRLLGALDPGMQGLYSLSEPCSIREATMCIDRALSLLRTVAGAQRLNRQHTIPPIYLFGPEPYLKGNLDYIYGLLREVQTLYSDCRHLIAAKHDNNRKPGLVDIHPIHNWVDPENNRDTINNGSDLGYSQVEIHQLELSLLSWLYSLGIFTPYGIPGVPESFDVEAVRLAVENGLLLCDLAQVLTGTKVKGLFRNPKNPHTQLQNLKLAFRTFRSMKNVSLRHLKDPQRILNGDRMTFLGLLEDLHRLYDGVKVQGTPSKQGPYYGDHVPPRITGTQAKGTSRMPREAGRQFPSDRVNVNWVLPPSLNSTQTREGPDLCLRRGRVVSIDSDLANEPFLSSEVGSTHGTKLEPGANYDIELNNTKCEEDHVDIFPSPFPYAYPTTSESKSSPSSASFSSEDVDIVPKATDPSTSMAQAESFFEQRIQKAKGEATHLSEWTEVDPTTAIAGVSIPPTTVLVDWLFEMDVVLQNPELLEFEYGEEFSDGLILCQIAEKLKPVKGGLKGIDHNPRTHASKRHNIQVALQHLESIKRLPLEILQCGEAILIGDNNVIVPLIATLWKYCA